MAEAAGSPPCCVEVLVPALNPARSRPRAAGSGCGRTTRASWNLQPAYADLHLPREALPVAHRLGTRVLSLPCGPHLTAVDRERVIEALADLP